MTKHALFAIFLISTLHIAAVGAQHPDDVFVGQKAPELKSGDAWFNSGPLKLEQLRGKVVLIDFWSFDCAYCMEALPHVKALYEKYRKDGLVVIGVHAPRADYEKNPAKVKAAIAKRGIQYPVVVDNDHKIWGDYLCNSWPSHFVIDQDGIIRLSHSGTERYEDTERVIQELLAKNDAK
jgi:peroxiredoxin